MTNDPSYVPPRGPNESHVQDDINSATDLRIALVKASHVIARLNFRFGWPVQGYDQESTLEMLRDLMPSVHGVHQAIYQRAEEQMEMAL